MIFRIRLFLVVVVFAAPPVSGGARENDTTVLGIVRTSKDSVAIGPFEQALPSDRDWSSALRVVVSVDGDVPPVSGIVKTEGKSLVFQPTFPFSSRATYRLEFSDSKLGKLSEEFHLPREDSSTPRAEVIAVFPTAEALPENQLKFYIHFSQPMSRGEAYQHVRLVDEASGSEIADPFLELAEELWDAEGKRLTVFLDPGRVKRGLKPHEDVGPVLQSGKKYTLRIDADWKDAQRRPLAKAFNKGFRTEEADYIQPNPDDWKLNRPAPGTREPLEVGFGEPLDRALMDRLLEVRLGGKREPIKGIAKIGEDESSWEFTPENPWSEGGYELHAGSELEDLAGNSIHKPFEVTPDNPGRFVVGPTVARKFSITD